MSKKGKKPSSSATNGKAHKNGKANGKSVGNGKHPEAESASVPMQAALAAVAAMPVTKETKLDAIIRLLKRPEGATLEDMVAATGWQKHTVRAALSHALAKKRGYQIVSDKPMGGQRIYKIVGSA